MLSRRGFVQFDVPNYDFYNGDFYLNQDHLVVIGWSKFFGISIRNTPIVIARKQIHKNFHRFYTVEVLSVSSGATFEIEFHDKYYSQNMILAIKDAPLSLVTSSLKCLSPAS